MKHKYLGICTDLRSDKVTQGEECFQIMMKKKKRLPSKLFLLITDISKLLDEDETEEDYINARIKEDPDTKFYFSIWGTEWGTVECTFIQTCGFEYIFI